MSRRILRCRNGGAPKCAVAERLETRVLLSGDHFVLNTPSIIVAGSPLPVLVTAVNGVGIDTSYSGGGSS